MIRHLKSGMVINCHKKGGSFFQGGFSGSMFKNPQVLHQVGPGVYIIARVCFPLESQKKTKMSVEEGGGQDVFKHLDGNLKIKLRGGWPFPFHFPIGLWPKGSQRARDTSGDTQNASNLKPFIGIVGDF